MYDDVQNKVELRAAIFEAVGGGYLLRKIGLQEMKQGLIILDRLRESVSCSKQTFNYRK